MNVFGSLWAIYHAEKMGAEGVQRDCVFLRDEGGRICLACQKECVCIADEGR